MLRNLCYDEINTITVTPDEFLLKDKAIKGMNCNCYEKNDTRPCINSLSWQNPRLVMISQRMTAI